MPIQAWYTLPFSQTKGLIFDLTIAQAHAENKSPASHHVERGGLLGHGHGVEQWQQINSHSETHRPGLSRKAGGGNGRLQHLKLGRQEVLPKGQHVKAQVVRQAYLFDGLGKALSDWGGG